jgi:hypothetical protein
VRYNHGAPACRMTRRLLNLLTLLSLLLCVAAAGMWVRSHFAQDIVERTLVSTTPHGFRYWELGVATWEGVVRVAAVRHEFDRAASPSPQYELSLRRAASQAGATAERTWRSREAEPFPVAADQRFSRWGFIGQFFNEDQRGHRGFGVTASSPWWFVMLLCSIPADLWLVSRFRRARRRARSRCPACGYSLAGNDSAVCPECGAAK